MTAPEALEPAAATTARFREAVEAGDVEGVVETLAPEVVVTSPITDRAAFHGREEVRELLGSVFETISDIRYFADVGDARTRALFYRASVHGEPVEEATRVELDADDRITAITLFFRPLPGLATLTAALVPRVARTRRGRLRAAVVRVLLAPLGLATRGGDRLTRWFV
jgi:hypothetical protein